MPFVLLFPCSAAPFCLGHLAPLVLQFALGVMMMCSGNYYREGMMMMSFHVRGQRGVCGMLLAPSCCLAAAPLNLGTDISWLFRMQPCHIMPHRVATDSPPPHQHRARSETEVTLKSCSSLSGRGAGGFSAARREMGYL